MGWKADRQSSVSLAVNLLSAMCRHGIQEYLVHICHVSEYIINHIISSARARHKLLMPTIRQPHNRWLILAKNL